MRDDQPDHHSPGLDVPPGQPTSPTPSRNAAPSLSRYAAPPLTPSRNAAPSPIPSANAAPSAGSGPVAGAVIDLSVPPPRAEHTAHTALRRRTGVLTVAAVAVMAAGGVAYALVADSGTTPAPATARSTPALAAVPDVTTPDERTIPRGTRRQTTTANPPSAPVTPSTTPSNSPSGSPGPHPSRSASPTPPAATALTATYTYKAKGLTDFVGTVRVANPSNAAVTGWTVEFVEFDGLPVHAAGSVTVTQNGAAVHFRPQSKLAAHTTQTFTFTVAGSMTELPSGCSLDNGPCS